MKSPVIKTIAATVSIAAALIGFGPYVNAATIGGGGDTDFSGSYADYSEITFTTPLGGKVTVSLNGNSVNSTTSYNCDVQLQIRNGVSGALVTYDDGSNISLSTSSLSVRTPYYVVIIIDADGEEISHTMDIAVNDHGSVQFIKSGVYDFNVERCSELWTDEQSLQECLEPMNDQECDDPDVIAKAEEITAGCTDDYQKSFAIYTYIIDEFAYDYDEANETTDEVYQDDADTLLRRSRTICEGLANTFVALARASGIPAAVSFGVADDFEFGADEDTLSNESPNHAWAVVFIDGEWYHIDPTWDGGNSYEDGERTEGEHSCDYYLIPLEVFSNDHKICDADTRHGIESEGSCGTSSSYSISRDGVITFSGSGSICLPDGVNGFRKVEFDPDSNITEIGSFCFVDCDIIESVILPDTVTSIDKGAFYTCEDLEYVYIPESVTKIDDEAFDVCDELAYIRIPDGCILGSKVFECCPRLIVSIPHDMSANEVTSGLDVLPADVIIREA